MAWCKTWCMVIQGRLGMAQFCRFGGLLGVLSLQEHTIGNVLGHRQRFSSANAHNRSCEPDNEGRWPRLFATYLSCDPVTSLGTSETATSFLHTLRDCVGASLSSRAEQTSKECVLVEASSAQRRRGLGVMPYKANKGTGKDCDLQRKRRRCAVQSGNLSGMTLGRYSSQFLSNTGTICLLPNWIWSTLSSCASR